MPFSSNSALEGVEIDKILHDERFISYFFNRCLRVHVAKLESGRDHYTVSAEMACRHNAIICALDTVNSWLHDMIGTAPTHDTVLNELNGMSKHDAFLYYESYCARTGDKAVSECNLNDRLKNDFELPDYIDRHYVDGTCISVTRWGEETNVSADNR